MRRLLVTTLLFILARASGGATNLGIAAVPIHFKDGHLVFQVQEFNTHQDLNGDGDQLDTVRMVYDVATGVTTNIGFAATDSSANASSPFDGVHEAFLVNEVQQGGVDLNGDGDANDFVPHVYNIATDGTANVGVAALGFSYADDTIVMTVREADQGGADLNGDGDSDDDVVFAYTVSNGTLTNIGFTSGNGVFPITRQGRIGLDVSEAKQGGLDLNDDGDAIDRIAHVYDLATQVTINLGLASGVYDFDGRWATLAVSEFAQGHTDLNGDGDGFASSSDSDIVVYLYDANTDTAVNIGLTTFQGPRLVAGHVEVEVAEHSHAQTDLNGDGDAFDSVIQIYDIATNTTTNLGLAVVNVTWVSGDRVAFLGRESSQNADLNGDGDLADNVVHVHDTATSTTTNLGLAGTDLDIDGASLVLRVREALQGAADLNGDGDSSDDVFHVYDLATGTITNVGLASTHLLLEGGHVAVQVSEAGQGGTDLNGDGDALDGVLHVHDPATGVTTNAGLAGAGAGLVARSDAEHVAFSVFEHDQGGADLNGDGDATDLVLHLFPGGDETAPVITPHVSGTLGSNGWYLSNVTVTWTVDEPESTVGSTAGCSPVTLSADTAGTTLTCQATSAGGASSMQVTIQRDATPPTVTCDAPAPSLLLAQAGANVSATVSDVTSGAAVSPATAAAVTSSVGAKTVSVPGSDLAGNGASPTCPYTVVYNVEGGSFFSSPVQGPPAFNRAKAGQVVPIKWRLVDANGQPVTNVTGAILTITSLACSAEVTADLTTETSPGGSGFHNQGDGDYQFNWATPKSYASSCKTLHLDLGEGLTHDALFTFTK